MFYIDDFIYPGYMNQFGRIPFYLSDTTYLDNMFIEIGQPSFELILGKQQISPGVGYAWNPTDIFNLKDLFDPTYEQTGVKALSLNMSIGSNSSLTAITQLKDSKENSTVYLQIKTGIGRFDISGVYSESRWEQTTLLLANQFSRTMIGFNLEGEMFGFGVHTEGARNYIDGFNNSSLWEYVVGLDYTTESSLYILGEYFHNDFGKPAKEINIDDFITTFAGERHSLNQDYFFSLFMYPLTDLAAFSLFTIHNLEDKSGVLNTQLDYNLFENVDLNLVGSYFMGEDPDEFGYQDYGFRARIKVYF